MRNNTLRINDFIVYCFHEQTNDELGLVPRPDNQRCGWTGRQRRIQPCLGRRRSTSLLFPDHFRRRRTGVTGLAIHQQCQTQPHTLSTRPISSPKFGSYGPANNPHDLISSQNAQKPHTRRIRSKAHGHTQYSCYIVPHAHRYPAIRTFKSM